MDYAVLIGRFQPFHLGHAALLAKALETAPQVLVIIGSAHHAPCTKNPFSWQERAAMIAASLAPEERARVRFVPVRDYYNDQRWAAAVRAQVPQGRVALIGHRKDNSSYYLEHFPDWHLSIAGRASCPDATELRALLFGVAATSDGTDPLAAIAQYVPAAVSEFLGAWSKLALYADLALEARQLRAYRTAWQAAPFPPVFVTVDAVVVCASHVLLVQRGGFPGKGLWALPGGFLDQHERLLPAALRELREETGLEIATDSLRAQWVFDHPARSERGRTITHAYYFALTESTPPSVQAADDAAVARWTPLSELLAMEARFFNDHFHILDHFLHLA